MSSPLLLAALAALAQAGEDPRAWSAGMCDGRIAPPMAPRPHTSPHTRNNLPTPEIIRSNGYPVEEHWVTTSDGYILALHRIPHGLTNGEEEGPRPALLLQHGILCSSADWVISTPSKGLGYILADAGYDVWLGNFRGNTYSRNHTYLNPDGWLNHKFWDFSWDEMAKYDIPTMVETVLEVTGQEDLLYVGHSMATTSFMAMAHYRPDIMARVRLANLLAPVASVVNMEGPIGWIARIGQFLDDFFNMIGVGEFLAGGWIFDCLSSLFCQEGEMTQGICSSVLFVFLGWDEAQLNMTLLPDIIHHTPAGVSTHTLLHYAQEHNSVGFFAYDWGSDKKNIEHHQSTDIPVYDLGAVTSPVALYWSDNDYFAEAGDIMRTIEELPNVLPGMNHEVEFKTWAHVDFMWGIDADRLVYRDLLKNLRYCTENDCKNL